MAEGFTFLNDNALSQGRLGEGADALLEGLFVHEPRRVLLLLLLRVQVDAQLVQQDAFHVPGKELLGFRMRLLPLFSGFAGRREYFFREISALIDMAIRLLLLRFPPVHRAPRSGRPADPGFFRILPHKA